MLGMGVLTALGAALGGLWGGAIGTVIPVSVAACLAIPAGCLGFILPVIPAGPFGLGLVDACLVASSGCFAPMACYGGAIGGVAGWLADSVAGAGVFEDLIGTLMHGCCTALQI